MREPNAEAARDFLLQSAEVGTWTLDYASKSLGVDRAAARDAIAALEAIGYVDRVRGKREAWRNTPEGNAVAGVSKAPPIRRATAQKAMAELVERAGEINRNDRFLFRVERVVVFGPFVTTNLDRLKNVDIAVELAPKERDPARLAELVHEHAEAAMANGKRFKSYADRLAWGANEVRAFLKDRTRAIALHDLDDWILRAGHRVIFQAT